jgi:hypothetical protein
MSRSFAISPSRRRASCGRVLDASPQRALPLSTLAASTMCGDTTVAAKKVVTNPPAAFRAVWAGYVLSFRIFIQILPSMFCPVPSAPAPQK